MLKGISSAKVAEKNSLSRPASIGDDFAARNANKLISTIMRAKSAPVKKPKGKADQRKSTLDDTVKAATAAGMSYGQYVLMRDYLHKEV